MKDEKILNLRLFYKGKNLDNAREIRDIKDKFVIGSDKSLQWQILDSRFPKKHLLVKRTKDKFKLFVGKGMKLTVQSGDQVIDESTLKSKNILKGNALLLDKGLTGRVDFADNWYIAFEYITPWKKIITAEERKLIQEYQRYPELSPQQKLLRNMFIIAILILLIFGFLFEKYYTPPVIERTVAHLVSIPVTQIVVERPVFTEAIVADEGVTEEPTEVGPPSSVDRLRGLDFSAMGAPGLSAPTEGLQLITYGERITAGGGAGAGTGPGGAGIGAGRATFDPGATGPRVDAGTVLGGGIDVGRLGIREVDASLLAGQTGIQATHINTAGQLAALAQARQRAASQGLKTVTEEAMTSAAPAVQATMANIRQYVDTYWRQIEELFNEERQIRDMYGSIVITLYFSSDGRVEGVDIDQRPGSFFTDSFQGRAREIMMGWRIPTTEQMQPYQFTRRFIRN